MKKLTALPALILLSALQPFSPSAIASTIAPQIDRSTLSGIDTLLYKTGAQNIITIEAALPAGNRYNPPANPAIAMLTAAMLDQGTATRDKYAIAAQLEAVGATLSFDSDATNITISAKCLTKDAPLVIALIAEQLRAPAFHAGEFAKIKVQLTGALQRALESTDTRARLAFAQTIYPATHPNYRPPIETTLRAIDAATLDDIKKFHAANYGPAQFTLVAVGDIDAPAIKTAITKNFSGWTGGNKITRQNLSAEKTTAPSTAAPASSAPAGSPPIAIQMPDKTSISIVWGQRTRLLYGDPEYHALDVATQILGIGFTGRLLANVRDRDGLTYGIAARLGNDATTDGDWRIVGTFAPALLDKGIAATRRELTEWYEKGVTADELANRKSNIIGAYKVSLATTEGMAAAILAAIQRAQPLATLDTYPAAIDALTLAQVNAAIKTHLTPSQMTLIEAGTIPGEK